MHRLRASLIALGILGMLALVATHHPDLFIERTTSMTPLIKPGDLILSEHVQPGQAPRVGQIAGYQYGGMLIAHRVIAANANGSYVFKGDANPTADPAPVNIGQIQEIVVGDIPLAGAWLEALTRPLGSAVVALLIVTAGAGVTWRHQRRVIHTAPAPLLEFRRRADERKRRAA